MKNFRYTAEIERFLDGIAMAFVGVPSRVFGKGRDFQSIMDYRPLASVRPVLSQTGANGFIRNLIESPGPAMAARFGSTELRAVVRTVMRDRRDSVEKTYALISRLEPPFWTRWQYRNLYSQSGFFPLTPEAVAQFTALMVDSMEHVDLLGSWVPGENLFSAQLRRAQITDLESLEPFWISDPWTAALENLQVLVVHPFSDSILDQYKVKRSLIFPGTNTLPNFELRVVKAVQSLRGGTTEFATWFDALDHMFFEAMKKPFDVALVGCGAYGFPLAARLKRAGKKVVHLGGVLQLLFGIKGKRWDDRPAYRALYNDSWTRPSPEETPPSASQVDGGVYW